MKTALGRGLDALIPEKGLEIVNLQISKIVPNKKQPRKNFKDSALKDLAQSIKERGVIQPILVSKKNDGSFNLIAGERRWRAASMAGLSKIPAVVKSVDEKDSLEIALIENIQRENLNPMEMASSFDYLLNTYDLTQDALSQRIGKDRATIANYMRLLKLPVEVQKLVSEESISMGHARAILGADNKKKQIDVARTTVKKGLSVREVEELIREKVKIKKKTEKRPADPHVKDVEERLTSSLGTKVHLKHKGGKGKIEIEYYSLEELDRLLEMLT
ncbi:MAG: ParB/RepB/Spo0J family partition protein [Nitrospirota bacterium]|nr:MAG: ParB/RepB/Spo0J family partition protein [Nitrospirota bacterium]